MILFFFLYVLTISSEILSNQGLALTIYNDGYAIIKDKRKIVLDTGQSYLTVTEMAATIEPETVAFRTTNQKQTIKVLQQNFENNLVERGTLFKKYINKNVRIYVGINPEKIEYVEGILLAYTPSFLVKTSSGVQVYDEVYGVVLSDLPNGLLVMPALLWKVKSPFQQEKKLDCQIAYKASGFSWKADYNIIISQDQQLIDLSGWVTIDNRSGKQYKQAKIKLIAGQVHTIPKPIFLRRMRMAMSKGRSFQQQKETGASPPLVTQKSFGDYHMYTISNKVSLNESSLKQIQFITTIKAIPIRKYYFISINTGGSHQNIVSYNMISFNNSKQNKAGIPLPKGNVKILKQDSEDLSLELLKEGSIGHSPKNQLVKLNSGSNSFIVVKKTINSKLIKLDGSWNASILLQIQNRFHKSVQIQLSIKNSYGDNLEIQLLSDQIKLEKKSVYEKKSIIKIDAGQKKKIQWNEEYKYQI